jgi:Fe-S oxidoreductase
MAAVHHVERGAVVADADLAATSYACTGCLRCTAYCKHDTRVATTLFAARASAVRAGLAPSAALRVIARHPERTAAADRQLAALFPDAPTEGDVAFVPGCTAATLGQDDVRAGERLVALATGRRPPIVAGCCGLPLLEAGAPEAFLTAATRFRMAAAGFDRLVFLDPGCLHALRNIAPIGDRRSPELLHLTELLERDPKAVRLRSPERRVRYHDACRLGRGLGLHDAPRRLLARRLGEPPLEFADRAPWGQCAGGGGQLPRTDPGAAEAIATERLNEHAALGGGEIVTACPAARHMFRRAGFDAHGLASVLAEGAPDLPTVAQDDT